MGIFTAARDGDHRRSPRRRCAGERIFPARDIGTVELGVQTSHGPVILGECQCLVAVGLGVV